MVNSSAKSEAKDRIPQNKIFLTNFMHQMFFSPCKTGIYDEFVNTYTRLEISWHVEFFKENLVVQKRFETSISVLYQPSYRTDMTTCIPAKLVSGARYVVYMYAMT